MLVGVYEQCHIQVLEATGVVKWASDWGFG